jgi:hypothetical protein
MIPLIAAHHTDTAHCMKIVKQDSKFLMEVNGKL